jgi:hypothetical protein
MCEKHRPIHERPQFHKRNAKHSRGNQRQRLKKPLGGRGVVARTVAKSASGMSVSMASTFI